MASVDRRRADAVVVSERSGALLPIAKGVVMGVRVQPGPSWRSSTPERVLQASTSIRPREMGGPSTSHPTADGS